MKPNSIKAILFVLFLGILDTAYLTWEHFANTIPPCSASVFVDCGKVLRSQYSTLLGIPLAAIGLANYLGSAGLVILSVKTRKRVFGYLLLLQTVAGALTSVYLMYLQFVVIGSICIYCTASALISFSLFYFVWTFYEEERKRLIVIKTSLFYKFVLKNILFLINPEIVHQNMLMMGNLAGKSRVIKKTSRFVFDHKNQKLVQKIDGINFTNPIGLAAGFDYEAQLTQFLPSLNFGFMSVGTVTNMAYEGNPRPMLGRLPKSKSLMVNKGFKSTGTQNISRHLTRLKFDIPVGVSIGRTNSEKLASQSDSVKDIVEAFTTFEKSSVNNSYYELNISCPNLIHGNVSFYPPKNLDELLREIDRLKINKPIFVKMPIERSDEEVFGMLKVIAKHSPKGVIFGNLQKDRSDPTLVKEEVDKFKVGYFSGKPTYKRSNELIKLAYKHYKDRFTVIGCGGVFSGRDAWEKITSGASLVQLITGLVFEGPQLVSQINFELADIMTKEGYATISDAVGVKSGH